MGVKSVCITFSDEEFERLNKVKGNKTWRQFFLDKV
jgi:hypothetical protein